MAKVTGPGLGLEGDPRGRPVPESCLYLASALGASGPGCLPRYPRFPPQPASPHGVQACRLT